MKVIKEGKNPDVREWSAEFECTGHGNGGQGCGAILLVAESDLYRTESHARDETTSYITFMCPQCGQETDIRSSDGYRHENIGNRVARDLPFGSRDKVKQSQKRLRDTGEYVPPHRIG
jgi:hypothetical protein